MKAISIPLSVFSTAEDSSEHNRMREYFIALLNKHWPALDPAPTLANVDPTITMLIMSCLAANKQGLPDPFPWFSAACAFALDQDLEVMMREETGETPTLN